MKHLTLILIVVLFSCVKSPAPVYNIPITGSGSYNLLGSQFITTETVTSYSTDPSDNDLILFWDVPSQDFDPVIPTYIAFLGQWDVNAPIPLGTLSHSAFFYVRQTGDTSFNRNVTPVTPTPTPAMLPNLWYALSSQTPVNAQYGDLVGVPGTATPPGLLPGTVVMHWDVTTVDFQTMWRFVGGQWWRYASGAVTPAQPLIPQFEGAFVGRFTAPCSPAPSLQGVTVSGCCAPDVTLTLTFSGDVDVITAGIPANYVIGPGGLVTGVSVQTANTATVGSSGLLMPTATSVVLTVQLNTQCGNTYSVSAPGVRCLGGTAVTGALNFSLTGCGGPPPNDTVGSAIPLTSGVTVYGSLKLADCTPGSAVSLFPPGAGANAKDVWYTYTTTPGSSGPATIDTCYALPSGCPQSDLVIAVYKMNGVLVPISGSWVSQSVACLNPKGVQVQFNSQPCKTYLIRVSGKAIGTLPGDFALRLTVPNAVPLNNACLSAIVIGPNSSTPFNTTSATTDGPGSEPVFNDVWYSFQWPAGPGGPYATVVETCGSTFNTAFAVYAVGGPCPGTVVPLTTDSTCATHAMSFLAIAGQQYLIRVGGATAGDKGCGVLHLTSGIPSAGTSPVGSSTYCKKYRIQGLPTGVGWTWQLTAPSSFFCFGFNVTDTVGSYSPAPLTAFHLAQVFASSINTHPGFTATAVNLGNSGIADLQICFPCKASTVALHVNGCWVDISSCSFNPDISDLDDSDSADVDCNNNGQSDYLDILDGTSSDVDGNGVPDECQLCVGATVVNGPLTTSSGVGGTTTLTVQAAGSAPFSYQWSKDGATLSGQTNATLVLTNLTLDAAGLYDVVVTNACGQAASPSAALYVDPRPALNIAQAGADVVLAWSDVGFHLQANPELSNSTNWNDVVGASPVTIPLTNSALYFRLQQAP